MSRFGLLAGGVATLLAGAFALGSAGAKPHHPPAPGAHDNDVSRMLREIDPRRLRANDLKLVGFGTRNTLSAQDDPNRGIGAARDWIKSQFDEIAATSGGRMTVALDPFIQPVSSRIPVPTPITNVVATLHGDQPESTARTYVVTGHYDSICTNPTNTTCDALSIGGNHLTHALRRNVNMTILLFNNRIYGLTKGQYSPTSEPGKVTKSTPMGSVDHPFNPVSLALGAEGSFVARTIDSDRKHLTAVLSAAAAHRGTSFVEIYQNCPIFNDGAFDAVKSPAPRDDAIIPLVHGEPIRFGADGSRGLIHDNASGGVKVVEIGDGSDQVSPDAVLVHDAYNPDATSAFAISRLTDAGRLHQAPIGIFRQVVRPTYDDQARDQIMQATAGVEGSPSERLAALIGG